MRKLFVSLVALGTFALVAEPAFAGKVSISKRVSAGQLKTACDKAGGMYSGPSSGGNYSCVGGKGAVFCKTGKCTGYCDNCGKAAAPAKTDNGRIPGILTNAPATNTQPLKPQQTTTSPARAPGQPLTQQTITRGPGTAPAQQKTTDSAGARPMQPLTASSSPRSRGR
jgi:hypothetical protein